MGLCANLGLYGKELVAIDGSKFKAVNGRERNFSDKKLRDRMERIDAKIDRYMKELESNDKAECGADGGKSAAQITEIAMELAQTGETQKLLTDADSRLMKTKDGVDVCYNVQTAVDSKHKLIAEFEVTNRVNDYNQLRPMAAKAADAGYDGYRGLRPRRVRGTRGRNGLRRVRPVGRARRRDNGTQGRAVRVLS